ncbi:lysine--tRNA ligase [Helicobacter winghamensis]|uniref:Lysine--tRNA ligase n=1 Tax=Helicobacter winghamensis TaxID=157268 RepID=A0A2N3PI63_9HELI|nr:lysine--tRNA ligase [Helicobacter winghamensis]EEO26089.1 lysine--tRNA ligase [Helicobacter winghamensis ATCC BAA-430]PKT75768.1 lysine--tRNA ligase [Helicobacter winghamensis]PKT75977.1 lysine--tRNA ligase [Helicobacter winghamensis]PKT76214.1 lysine--tRNA ligase [Helicobacter winghamensis]PKT80360.1 lysine--tRNA ligase [Helicobacter winghamensis]
MFENDMYVAGRIAKADALRQIGINPYGNGIIKESSTQEFLQTFKDVQDLEERKDTSKSAQVAGRIKFIRLMGKAAFIKIEDYSGVLQVYLSKNELDENFEVFKKYIEVGDIVVAKGFPFVTKTGELSLHALEFKILTKAISPLPEKFHGLVDIELRYRQRYLDLIMNSKVRDSFILRSRIVSCVRKFFESKEFLEVETPMMHPIPGGANAKPFVTYHNALNVERYLRIAPELYLKRLIVGGFEAVFEINRNFRNEGMDHSHNPEFTMIEFYWAYKDYKDLIALTKELFYFLLEMLKLPKQLEFNGKSIDFSTFREISYEDALVEIGGIPRGVATNENALYEYLLQNNVKLESKMELGKLQSEAFDAFVEEKLINPTFITDFPIAISPLARRNDTNPYIADRFELFIGGSEIANGFSELNDPLDQLERFKAQVAAKEAGDEEAQYMDEDYITALSYGMPPTAGEGIGIDRLVMLLTGNISIKDVILFPALKPQKKEIKEEK